MEYEIAKKLYKKKLILLSIGCIIIATFASFMLISSEDGVTIDMDPSFLSEEEVKLAKKLSEEGTKNWKNKNFLDSIKFFEASIEINPTDISNYINLGYSYLTIEMIQESKDSFLKAYYMIQNESDVEIYPGAQLGLAFINILEKNFSQAEKLKVEALEYENDTSEYYLFLSQAYFKINQSQKSMELLEIGELEYPNNPYLIREKAYIYYHLKNYEVAERYAREDLFYDKDSVFANRIIGLIGVNIHQDMSLAKPYLENFNQFITGPDMENGGHNALARVYLFEGNTEESRDLVKEVINYYETSYFNYSQNPEKYFREKMVYEDAILILQEIESISS